jgi:hypothetical protein
MSGTNTKATQSKKMLDIVHHSGLVNLEHLGKVVDQVTPGLRDPGVTADDYIAKVYDSVIQVWKTMPGRPGIDQVSDLATIGKTTRPG